MTHKILEQLHLILLPAELVPDLEAQITNQINDFIQEKLSLERAATRQEVVKALAKLRLPAHQVEHNKDCIECKETEAYNAAIIDCLEAARHPSH